MSEPAAYGVFQEFPVSPAQPFQVERHYLLYASSGAMRLEAEGKTWSLPPARAALITAGKPITVTLPQKMTICSALFSTTFAPPPPAALTVFEMTPLARELILTCAKWGPDSGPLDDYTKNLFETLASVAWRLAETPSQTAMPAGKTAPLRKALEITDSEISNDPRFEDIAKKVAMTPRSLARRFSDELGMNWRQTVRKMRMIRAIEALAGTDASVTDVAFSVGYNSMSAFNAAFREFTGKTPTDYRESFKT